jgi:hypothetical protein
MALNTNDSNWELYDFSEDEYEEGGGDGRGGEEEEEEEEEDEDEEDEVLASTMLLSTKIMLKDEKFRLLQEAKDEGELYLDCFDDNGRGIVEVCLRTMPEKKAPVGVIVSKLTILKEQSMYNLEESMNS